MELVNGDERNPNGSDFPHNISPFPATDGLLVPSSVAALHSSDLDTQNLPPQKLRPIRASGRSPSGSHDLPPACALGGTFDKFGLLVDQVCEINGVGSEYFAPPVKAEATDFGMRAFGDNRLQCLLAGCWAGIGSGTSGENGSPIEGGLFDDESSSSSSDDESSGIKENTSRKRKRKTRKKIENLVQKLVMKVMDKQEQMHRQLIETLERRERERVIKEEAWKQQQIQQLKKTEAKRAQDNARNLALISFIENIMGHKINNPQPIIKAPIDNEEETNVSIRNDLNSDPNNKRWPETEAQALVMLRASMEQKFRASGNKCSNVWDEISTKMAQLGYNRTAKKCKEKWENMNKYFRRSVGKKRYEKSTTCSYFNELQILYKNGYVHPGTGTTSDHVDIEKEMKSRDC